MKVKAVKWPHDGAVGFQVEEYVYGEWVSLLDTSSIGTFPDYTTAFTVTPYATSPSASSDPLRYRARWETGVDQFSSWFTPSLIQTPTAEQTERLTQAMIQVTTRFLKFPEAPFGHTGLADLGIAVTRPSREVEELLLGLRFKDWDIDFSTLVSTDDVIRLGIRIDPGKWSGDPADVQRAIDAAADWLANKTRSGMGVA